MHMRSAKNEILYYIVIIYKTWGERTWTYVFG